MDFYILLAMLSVVSIAMAFIAVGISVHFFGVAGTKAKIAQFVIVALSVCGWDFLVLISGGNTRLVLAGIPLLALAILLMYSRSKHDDSPEPHELINRKVSVKSQKAAEKRKRREEARQAARHPYQPENKQAEAEQESKEK